MKTIRHLRNPFNSSADSTLAPVVPAVVASAAASPTTHPADLSQTPKVTATPVPSSPSTTIHSVSLSDSTAITQVVPTLPPVPRSGASDQYPSHAVAWKAQRQTHSHCHHQRASTATGRPSWCRTRRKADYLLRGLVDALFRALLGRHESD
jgi:hypothetical protein